jgi:hypothetical protein
MFKLILSRETNKIVLLIPSKGKTRVIRIMYDMKPADVSGKKRECLKDI